MSLTKKIWCGALVSAALIGSSLAIAEPASAADRNAYCSSGWTCTWGDRYYLTSGSNSARLWFSECFSDYSGTAYPGTGVSGNDTATSIYNHGARQTVYMYKDRKGGGGMVLSIPIGIGYDQLNAQASYANDIVSSGYFEGNNYYPFPCV